MTVMEERFELASQRILEIEKEKRMPEQFQRYFAENADYLGVLLEEYKWIASGAMREASLQELERHNESCFIDLMGRNYETSYANPDWAYAQLGETFGQLLSAVAAELRSLPAFIYEQDLEGITIRLELFVEIYCAFAESFEETKEAPEYSRIRDIFYWFASDYAELTAEHAIRHTVDWGQRFALDIIENADLSDIRYLFRFGEYIADDQWKLAEHLNGLPEEKIQKIADTYTEGFRKGFELAKKPLDKKKSVQIRYPLGFERVVKAAIENFRKMGLEPVIARTPASFAEGRRVFRLGFFGGAVNRQFDYDHENDKALYLDKKYVHRMLECRKNAWEEYKDMAVVHAGPAVIEAFGEEPFEPASKEHLLTLSAEQQKLYVEYQSQAGAMTNEYIDPEERSFTCIAFPVPGIGEHFPEIFDEVLKINTLDYKTYETIQQHLIDALDKAAWVEIKGRGDNHTDMKVMLHTLNNPAQETNFENCVADVNIPVGEVFTSPQLAGTNGLLHVGSVYIGEFQFKDLEIRFENGIAVSYTCKNFETEEENKALVKQMILKNHETLPMGEFAIGTNTTAYEVALRYGILDKFPILIAEKMGPHFAVGDTCYSWMEDCPVFNPDGREMVARENEISAKRKENPQEAYLGCHTDITIPYSELDTIEAIHPDGTSVKIIAGGRFALPGTEKLNEPLEK